MEIIVGRSLSFGRARNHPAPLAHAGNTPTHSLRIARALHAEFPDVTFDATIKIEHILEHRALFPGLGRAGR